MIGFRVKLAKQKNILKKISSYQVAAFTLVEILVSVTLFSTIILASTSLFKLSIDAQRQAIATQNVQESLKYFLEMIAKEMRMAKKNTTACPVIPEGQIFYSTGDVLMFRNYYDDCVEYSLALDADNENRPRFKVKRDPQVSAEVEGFLSPLKIEVSSLQFVLGEQNDLTQPTVTVNLKAKAVGDQTNESEIILQTSITSRYYK